MTMNINAEGGDKVAYMCPGNGCKHDQELAYKYLLLGGVYIVKEVINGGDRTHVILEGFEANPFNSVMFEDVTIGHGPKQNEETVKARVTPYTHKINCGLPWRDLNVDGDSTYIAVSGRLGGEYVYYINSDGKAFCTNEAESSPAPEFNLIPIKKEHGLPTDLPMTARYAFKDAGGLIIVSRNNPKVEGMYAHEFSVIHKWLYGPGMLKNYKQEDSLHERTKDGGWSKVE